MIKLHFETLDGIRKTKRFKTLSGARVAAQGWVGKDAEIGRWYAVSADGVVKVTAEGCTLNDLWPDGTFKIYIVHGSDKYFETEAKAKEEVRLLREYDPAESYGPYGIEEKTVTDSDFIKKKED